MLHVLRNNQGHIWKLKPLASTITCGYTGTPLFIKMVSNRSNKSVHECFAWETKTCDSVLLALRRLNMLMLIGGLGGGGGQGWSVGGSIFY